MIWWQWVVLGIVLLGAEMMVDAEFYLVFLGVSAVSVGLIDLLFPNSPIWAEWLLFSALAIVTLVVFRARIYRKLNGGVVDAGKSLVGEVGTIEADIEPGATGRIELRGTSWAACNVGEGMLRRSERAQVESTSGLTVEVRSVGS